MKIFIFLNLISFSVLAGYDPSERYFNVRHTRIKIAKCGVEVLETYNKTNEDKTKAAAYVNHYFTLMNEAGISESKLDEAYYGCLDLKNRFYFDQSNDVFSNERISQIIQEILSPRGVCTSYNASLYAGFALGASAGVGFGKCIATNGASFIVSTPHLEVFPGVGFQLSFDRQSYLIDNPENLYSNYESLAHSAQGSFFFANSEQNLCEQYISSFPHHEYIEEEKPIPGEKEYNDCIKRTGLQSDEFIRNSKSFRVGLAWYGRVVFTESDWNKKGINRHSIKIFPLPKNYSVLVKRILNP